MSTSHSVVIAIAVAMCYARDDFALRAIFSTGRSRGACLKRVMIERETGEWHRRSFFGVIWGKNFILQTWQNTIAPELTTELIEGKRHKYKLFREICQDRPRSMSIWAAKQIIYLNSRQSRFSGVYLVL